MVSFIVRILSDSPCFILVTNSLLWSVSYDDPDDIFRGVQGESWYRCALLSFSFLCDSLTLPQPAGLNYIGLGIGLSFASQLNARYMDKIYIYLKNRNPIKDKDGNGIGQPEFRVPSMFLGSLMLPIGLLLSGWAAQERVHWVVTDIVGGPFELIRPRFLTFSIAQSGNGIRRSRSHSYFPIDADVCRWYVYAARCQWYVEHPAGLNLFI